MADVQISVGFRRETGVQTATVLSCTQIVKNKQLKKIEPLGFIYLFCLFFCHS